MRKLLLAALLPCLHAKSMGTFLKNNPMHSRGLSTSEFQKKIIEGYCILQYRIPMSGTHLHRPQTSGRTGWSCRKASDQL